MLTELDGAINKRQAARGAGLDVEGLDVESGREN